MKFSSSSCDMDARQSSHVRGLSKYLQTVCSSGRSWCRTWCSSGVMQLNSLSSMSDTSSSMQSRSGG